MLPLLLACLSAPPTTDPSPPAPDAREVAVSPARMAARAGQEPAPGSGPMDGFPPRRTRSPSGRTEVQVDEARRLLLGGRVLDEPVDPRVRFSADEGWLYYARYTGLGETELWRIALPDGSPEPVVQWPGTADRPSPSPDGRWLVFVSGRTGIAALWRVPLDGPLPVPMERGEQLTNHESRHEPGQPPPGFLPPPTTDGPDWVGPTLRWTAGGRALSLAVSP